MTDETHTGMAPNPVHPAPYADPAGTGSLKPQPYAPNDQPSGSLSAPRPEAPVVTPAGTKTLFGQPKPAVPTEPEVPKIDHLEEIAALVRSLHNISPSGAQTVGGQILEHLSALQNVRDSEADKTKAKV